MTPARRDQTREPEKAEKARGVPGTADQPPDQAPEPGELSRRERQILDLLYRLGKATAAQVREELPDAPSYSAVRALLRILEEKGHVEHSQEGPRYVYRPTVPRRAASRSALRHLVETFFAGRPSDAMAALIDLEADQLDGEQRRRLIERIECAEEEGR
ncbi:MAG: BlaI/MecI/CopY family transcriptional regulator [Acidobacteria bacterium]|nr:MAG: BlaI/MecI/CopY family transcriptional regulator [Acidobacteriota bacterium]REK04393.1 MAG: BlaI/MecI/CopY family transcriptional regulator [Acidobacteriota bacterium]